MVRTRRGVRLTFSMSTCDKSRGAFGKLGGNYRYDGLIYSAYYTQLRRNVWSHVSDLLFARGKLFHNRAFPNLLVIKFPGDDYSFITGGECALVSKPRARYWTIKSESR